MESAGTTRTALIIDGSYAIIGARKLGGKIDYIKLRIALEVQAATPFGGTSDLLRVIPLFAAFDHRPLGFVIPARLCDAGVTADAC